jgi:Protein of unknown function (DUF3108)
MGWRTASTLGLAVLASVSVTVPLRSQSTAASREASVPFKVGESLTYDVSWSAVLVAGTATAQVVDKKSTSTTGPGVYSMVVEGRPVPMLARLYNLYYKMDSLLDSVTLLSQRGTLYSEEGTDKTTSTTRFDRAARRAFYERQSDTTTKVDFAIPAGTQDGLAAFYTIRTHAFKAGERFSIPVADGGGMYTVQIDVAQPETVRVPVGEFSAWNVKAGITDAQGQAVWKNIVVWISNDARRLPLKMQAELPVGSFVLALRDAH